MLTYYIGEAHWEMQDFPETAKCIVEALEYAERAASILLFYYLWCASVLAAAQQLLGKSSPAQIQNALALVIAHGSSESTADVAYQAILLSAVCRRDEALPLKQHLESVGYQTVFYRSMLDVLEPSRV